MNSRHPVPDANIMMAGVPSATGRHGGFRKRAGEGAVFMSYQPGKLSRRYRGGVGGISPGVPTVPCIFFIRLAW
jgi:hypothetical protein